VAKTSSEIGLIARVGARTLRALRPDARFHECQKSDAATLKQLSNPDVNIFWRFRVPTNP
jgi:hypothetical protein